MKENNNAKFQRKLKITNQDNLLEKNIQNDQKDITRQYDQQILKQIDNQSQKQGLIVIDFIKQDQIFNINIQSEWDTWNLRKSIFQIREFHLSQQKQNKNIPDIPDFNNNEVIKNTQDFLNYFFKNSEYDQDFFRKPIAINLTQNSIVQQQIQNYEPTVKVIKKNVLRPTTLTDFSPLLSLQQQFEFSNPDRNLSHQENLSRIKQLKLHRQNKNIESQQQNVEDIRNDDENEDEQQVDDLNSTRIHTKNKLKTPKSMTNLNNSFNFNKMAMPKKIETNVLQKIEENVKSSRNRSNSQKKNRSLSREKKIFRKQNSKEIKYANILDNFNNMLNFNKRVASKDYQFKPE